MSRMVDAIPELLNQADDGDWMERTAAANEAAAVERSQIADAYAALFSSDLGRAVLDDMQRRYVDVTRWNPGLPPEQGFYREGMAQAVFDIRLQIEISTREEG